MEKMEPLGLDPTKKGTFTRFCKAKGHEGVTKGCIKEGLGSINPKTRKRANFALQFGHPEFKDSIKN